MVVLGIVLFISIAIPLQGDRIVCVAQFSRVPRVAVHQPCDRGEQKTDRYSTHQHSRMLSRGPKSLHLLGRVTSP